ncbi:MAG: DUF1592 domain-containing protein [Blastocatellia bacterium]|nr:DUF1592 domain-containing protein [Blastocatellia bacterium]
MMRLTRILIIALPLLWFVGGPPARQAQNRKAAPKPAEESFEATVLPFFAENCVSCHNEKRSTGGLNLEAFKTAASLMAHRDAFEHILQRLRSGEMPPKSAPQPEAAAVNAVVRLIEGAYARADKAARPDPGRVTARRLNRAEYNNTVRDLLGVHLRPADDFPQDDSGYGFDNIGDVLSLSPVLMEKYLASAEMVARAAVFGPEPLKPSLTRVRTLGTSEIKASVTPLVDYDQTGLSLPNAAHVTHRFPVDADYQIRAILGGVRPLGSEPLQLGLWVDGKLVQTFGFNPEQLASFSDDRQDFASMIHEFRQWLTAGEHWIAVSPLKMYEGLPASYNGPNPSTRPTPTLPAFRPPRRELPPERVEELRKQFEARRAMKVPGNQARIRTLEFAGPYNQASGPSAASLKKIFICSQPTDHSPSCARRIVSHVARRAWRRPVTPREVEQLTGLVTMAQQKGDSFEEGICLAIQAMLVSPHFLFRIEQDRQERPGDASSVSIGQHELASRLSYFLWSSMPDEDLLQAADLGRLRRPDVLTAQIQRMLADPKSQALVENFGGQWLELRKLESVKPDRDRFPEFDDYFRLSIRRETELFLENIVRHDGSILDLIDGNYSFLNERLARFYQIPGVTGPEFRKVAFAPGAERGGLLTQASILTVSSYATRTSPVLRGKWIMENMLNTPPPAPPPDVPTLDEGKVGSTASLRQQLEEHRKNPTCASCHSRMDPLGFGLEKFNAIGAWRTLDGKFPIDDSGILPDGRAFQGPGELKKIIRAERDAFTRGLTDKLLTYALGRGLERYDKPTVKKIADNVAARNYRFSSLVQEIVNSMPFQMRRSDVAKR